MNRSSDWRKLRSGVIVPRSMSGEPTYTAASSGRRVRAWRVPQVGPNTAIAHEVAVIRSRQRAAARNDPWIGAALEKGDANAIGTGIEAQMVNGSVELQVAIEKIFQRWTKYSDADGAVDWYGQQLLGYHEWREAGEVFVRRRPRRSADGFEVPLQLQMIEAEQCPADLNTLASNGHHVRCGIEFNAIGRRVAYWMYREHPGDYSMVTNAQELVRVPASEILHVYRPLRAGQIRGIPDAASVLLKAWNLDSLDDAVLERQKISNLFAGFYEKNTDPESAESIVNEMTDDEDETDDDDIPLAGLEPATMQELPPGWKANFTQPPSPGSDYAEYLRGHLLAIAARHNVPYEVMTGDLRNVSDRALRLILNEFRRALEMQQWLNFIPQFLQPAREWWFDAAHLAGVLPIADGEYQARRDELVETQWVPQGWPYSHPVQDVDADIKAIRAGLESRDEVVLRRGHNPRKVDEQNAAGNKRSDALGLVYSSDARKVSNAGVTQARPAGSALPRTTDDDDERTDDENGDDTDA